jgi:negative regulator of flagellin synthesis FlgM
MRIEKQFIATDKNEKATDTRRSEAKKLSGNGKGESASGVKKTDSVELSARSRDIAEIAKQLKDSSEVREELVNELRAKIKDGTYHVSGRDIAEKIVDKADNNIF